MNMSRAIVPTILIVDDNSLVRSSLAVALEDAGYSVLEAGDGKQALATLAMVSADLIVMDIRMPVLDGIEATRQLRKIAEFAQIPVIAFSGDTASLQSASNLFDEVLTKPLLASELIEAVERLLKATAVASLKRRA